MIFYLGSPEPYWLSQTDVPLFVSRRRIDALQRKKLPKALGPWALDSGGFKELEEHGRWTVSPEDYVREVRRCATEIGNLQWAAIQDWMNEPPIIYGGPTDPGSVAVGTGLSVEEHQLRTIESYCRLRELGGRDMAHLWAPVLQGWCLEDYLEHVNLWATWAKVDLRQAPVVGVGSICRRQGTDMAAALFRILTEQFGLRGHLHAFGAKTLGLQLEAQVGRTGVPEIYRGWGADMLAAGWPQVAVEQAMLYATSAGPSTWEESDVEVCRLLQSSDSMAWSVEARHHANRIRGLRDEAFGTDERGKPLWRQEGDRLLVGSREVGRVLARSAGQVSPVAPTQLLPQCADGFARGQAGNKHQSCASCLPFALAWRRALVSKLPSECRGTKPVPRPKLDPSAPLCAGADRVALRRAEAARYLVDLERGGAPDPRRWAAIQAMPGADGPLLPLVPGFERMERPLSRPMPEAELCRAWGTGRLRWGEARVGHSGDAPLPSPWQPWPAEVTERLLAEHGRPETPAVSTALMDSLRGKRRST